MAENLSALFTNSTNRSISGTSAPNPSIYIFTPAGSTIKQALVFSMVTVALIGFVGGSLILHFLSQNKQPFVIQSSRFIKNLNLYIKSLALSDILSTLVSLPLTCIQISFDLFQTHWACKIVRYFNIVFPVITIYNLVVIGIEKHLSLRRVPRTLSATAVRKLIFLAWFAGFAVVLLPATTFTGIRHDLNETHFTVICKYVTEYLPARIAFVSFTALVYYLSVLFFDRSEHFTGSKGTLTAKSEHDGLYSGGQLQAGKTKGYQNSGNCSPHNNDFAFIIPYFGYMGYAACNMIAKPDIDFQTDYVIRFSSGVIAFSNSAVNFVIYVVQMRGFRIFLKKLVCSARPAVIPKQFDNAAKLDRGQRHIVHRLLKWLNWANTLNLLCIYFIRSYG